MRERLKAYAALTLGLGMSACQGPSVGHDRVMSRAPSSSTGLCIADRRAVMNLSEAAFDQDLSGGWREVARRPECAAEAADLIQAFRLEKGSTSRMLFWHEGQLRAGLGQTSLATDLFQRSRILGPDRFGWNIYVDATTAFLSRDRPALIEARRRLAELPRPEGFDPRDQQGSPLAIRWPPNLNVVDGLLACFEKDYTTAYGPTCTRALTVGGGPSAVRSDLRGDG